MVLWISSISSRQSTDSIRRWTQQSLSCCVPLFIRTQQYLSYLCVSLALWSASTTAATTTTASNDNYNTTKKRHRAKPYLPPPSACPLRIIVCIQSETSPPTRPVPGVARLSPVVGRPQRVSSEPRGSPGPRTPPGPPRRLHLLCCKVAPAVGRARPCLAQGHK